MGGGLLLCKSWPEAGTFLLVLSLRRPETFPLSPIPLLTMLNLRCLIQLSWWAIPSGTSNRGEWCKDTKVGDSHHQAQRWEFTGGSTGLRVGLWHWSPGASAPSSISTTLTLRVTLTVAATACPLVMVIFQDLFASLPSIQATWHPSNKSLTAAVSQDLFLLLVTKDPGTWRLPYCLPPKLKTWCIPIKCRWLLAKPKCSLHLDYCVCM